MLNLDKVDQQLLALLASNSRASTSALARTLGVSRSTVQDRINRLERRKIIAGYTIRYHDSFSGRQLNAHVMIQVNPKQSQKIVEALSHMGAVKTVQTVSGIYDMVTTVTAATTQEMDVVLDDIGALPGVEKTTTSIVLTTKFER
ncbi:MAG: Lrp/AsnC family transcriptional regulator [Proteobacteria bacterium]|nr:Lrp/AsnC family transcriptional regulator [Pseudomonadota bacterium]